MAATQPRDSVMRFHAREYSATAHSDQWGPTCRVLAAFGHPDASVAYHERPEIDAVLEGGR
jgi:hypothetical protein